MFQEVPCDVVTASELYESGLTLMEIGERLGCSWMTVQRRLVAAGVEIRKQGCRGKKRNARDDELISQIIELHDEGLSGYKIAAQLDIGRDTVYRLLRKIGVHCNAPITLVCKRCGKSFVRQSPNQIYCSKTCSNAVYCMRRNDAKRAGVDEVETITLREVWERDHGRCYLCGRKTDWNDYHIVNGWRVTGPRYPSRDHVIALSNGGTHTRDNIRLACFECNANKNNHGQLRLAV